MSALLHRSPGLFIFYLCSFGGTFTSGSNHEVKRLRRQGG